MVITIYLTKNKKFRKIDVQKCSRVVLEYKVIYIYINFVHNYCDFILLYEVCSLN